MFKNNLKIAIRALLKNKTYAIINIAGLAVGVASCLLIALFVQNEFSYDRFFEDSDQLHRMVLERKYPDHSTFYAGIPHSFGNVAPVDYAEIESSTLLFGPFGNPLITYRNERDEKKEFEEEFVFATDPNFFSMFSLKVVKGDRGSLLHNPNDMAITESTANRYFGSEDPIGKVMKTPFGDFKITGVFEDLPSNSHLKLDFLVAIATFPFIENDNYTSFSAFCYFKLRPDTDLSALEAKFPKMVDTYASAQIERDLGKSWEDYKKEGNGYRYFLQPLEAIHLDPVNLEGQIVPGGNRTTVFVLISVALMILFIACINFMNLATARSSERAKEVGVRKTMGSFRQHLIFQFLTESFVLSLIGVLLALVLIKLALPYFNNFAGKELEIVFSPINILILLALTSLVGLLAGLYPSFVLSSFNPVVVLKGNFTGHQKGKWIRNSLVIFQFWISIVLMIGTLVIGEQMTFMREKSMGFDKEQTLIIEQRFNLEPMQAETFMQEIKRSPYIAEVASSFAVPGREGDFPGFQFQLEGSSEIVTTKAMMLGDRLPEMLGLELQQGKWFSEETNDSLSIILNESALRLMDVKNPIGSRVKVVQQTQNGNFTTTFTIIGIAKDFNFQSLRDQITPLVIQSNENFGKRQAYVMAKVQPGEIPNAIELAEAKWKELFPEQSFKYTFLDQDLYSQYEADQKTGEMFAVFSGLAIFVACIGLFALSSYTASLRTKEIGIRKVLGASVLKVLILLASDFTRMVLISFLLAVPIAWFAMENWWLQNFAYRIQTSVWTIFISGAAAFLVAWITVSFQSVKAAIKNPVQSLRSE